MATHLKSPSWRLSAIFLVALSLSIGWGIRGNFGHEYGAMIGGMLAAVAGCLVSGREDWRARLPYFAMFGALGWAFGGSISYMQVITYTHSGHAESVLFGFAGTYAIGFLWGSIGGAGVALPAVADRDFLTRLFKPICWVFVFWAVWELALADRIAALDERYSPTESRQNSPLYWFDSDWAQVLVAIGALCAYDLWNRIVTDRYERVAHVFVKPLRTVAVLALFAVVGAGLGYGVQHFGSGLASVWDRTSIARPISWSSFSRTVADPSVFDIPAEDRTVRQAALIEKFDGDKEAFLEVTMSNWPNFFRVIPQHVGWILGLTAGIGLYFAIFGRFQNGASLLMYMGVGWFAAFLLFPVIFGWRMTPPRGDNWAGILGVFAGTLIYCFRRGLVPVAYASIVSGVIGGLGFSGMVFLKLLMVWPGNPQLIENDRAVEWWQKLGFGRSLMEQKVAEGALDVETTVPSAEVIVEAWDHWQHSNWHSFYEQTYGFVNGIAIAVVLALLSTRIWRVDNEPRRRIWTEIFGIAFALLLLLYLNIEKNVGRWVEAGAIPETMTMPWFQSVELSSHTWFSLMWLTLCLAFFAVVLIHFIRPIAAIPNSWVGKGQLLYLVFLWAIVIANFERAVVGFNSSRLITEAVIFVNAAIVTVLILALPREGDYALHVPRLTVPMRYMRAALVGLIISAAAIFGQYYAIRYLYGDTWAGHSGVQYRLGDDAEWRVGPITRTDRHS